MKYRTLLALALLAAGPAIADESGRATPYEAHVRIIVPLRPAARERGAPRRVEYAAAVRLSGVIAPLAAKTREISNACGSTVISARRHTRVAGTGRMSLHASGRAVDMRGNPGCIYAHLTGWPGGYSTDYGRVKHVHISLGGSEDGLRFAHGGHRRHYAAVRVRYAHR